MSENPGLAAEKKLRQAGIFVSHSSDIDAGDLLDRVPDKKIIQQHCCPVKISEQ